MSNSRQREQEVQTNLNSALYWYPRLDDAAPSLTAVIPETEFVAYDFLESVSLMEGDLPQTLPWGEFVEAAETVGWPAFVRTDQKSVKHAGPGAYKATEPDDIPTIMAVLGDYHVKSNRHPAALMVREFVDINAAFRAFDGLPIGREFRVFASPDGATCEHFYWPGQAIEDGRGEPIALDADTTLSDVRWRSLLADLADIPDETLDQLRADAVAAAESLTADGAVPADAAWSVDFAQDTDGDWWLLDVALAEDSWHPDCPAAETGGDDNAE